LAVSFPRCGIIAAPERTLVERSRGGTSGRELELEGRRV
jgi:hypothetical protein